MAEADLGTRDARGEWQPAELIQTPPVFVWPPRPLAFLKWLFGFPGYLMPWNLFFVAVAIVSWLFLTPELERMTRFEPGWMIAIYLRNAAIMTLFFGAWHLRLYIRKAQGKRYKYNNRWLSNNSKAFLFRNQTRDNVFWSLVSGCGVWSLYEAVTLWMYANGHLPYVDFRTNPVYFVLLLAAVGLLREVHFYWVHRLIHWKPLYKAAHYLHHKNVNIGPWSGLAMHPHRAPALLHRGVLALDHPVPPGARHDAPGARGAVTGRGSLRLRRGGAQGRQDRAAQPQPVPLPAPPLLRVQLRRRRQRPHRPLVRQLSQRFAGSAHQDARPRPLPHAHSDPGAHRLNAGPLRVATAGGSG